MLPVARWTDAHDVFHRVCRKHAGEAAIMEWGRLCDRRSRDWQSAVERTVLMVTDKFACACYESDVEMDVCEREILQPLSNPEGF